MALPVAASPINLFKEWIIGFKKQLADLISGLIDYNTLPALCTNKLRSKSTNLLKEYA